SSKAKVKELEVFDGSDPQILESFLVSLSLVFLDQPNYFMDQQKIAYTISYLSSSAHKWFEPDILSPNATALPMWTRSFLALIKELQDNFGLYHAHVSDSLALTRDNQASHDEQ
ncbi:hypothetical protein J3R30DRAFT_3283926, partial [Lentinula aciculospora]